MAAADYTTPKKSNTQILEELEALSETLYQSHTTARRTASLVLPRDAIPPIEKDEPISLNPKPRSRRMSLSPWRSRPKPEPVQKPEPDNKPTTNKWIDTDISSSAALPEKKGIWGWKPIRALTHIGMQKLSCLFSVEIVTVQNLPPSMNGLRLSVCVRKKETKDGAVQTMPSRVSQGAADFEETLFVRSHVYFTPGSGTHMKFEPRPFLIYVVAVDAEELDFGKSAVDLSGLIQESIDKSFEGSRIRQWDISFGLSGKAKGGELVLKLGFQIMEKDGGVSIYSQGTGKSTRNYSPSIARKQSKTSFSVPSPRLSSKPHKEEAASSDNHHLQGMDDLNLDEPAKAEEAKVDDLPDFDVVDKGVEIERKDAEEEEEEEYQSADYSSDKRSVSSEVVKEVVQDQSHRLTELDSIAQQIKALESMMGEDKKTEEETGSQALDADEDKVTREFLQMLEDGEAITNEDDQLIAPMKLENYENAQQEDAEGETETEYSVFLPDLGKGLGCVVQTRNGGYLAATNPLDTLVSRKDTPKLAMQISKPLIIQSNATGFEVFQKMAAIGVQELSSELLSLMPIDELMGKTAEQIAFEGIASAIIQGRNKEGATSSAARTIAAVKSMATAMNTGRKERVSTGIWNVSEDPIALDEILSFSMQKIESMALDALKIQVDVAEEDAPFDVSPLVEAKTNRNILDSAISIDDWIKENGDYSSDTITVSVVVQLRDPLRQYEPVGGPMLALIHATGFDENPSEERKYKVGSLQVGGIKVRSSEMKNLWDSEKQKLTALQWLLAYGMGKAGKKGSKRVLVNGPDLLWSISSRVMADMWLKPIRNPDVKFNAK